MNKLVIADAFDLVAFLALEAITVDEVLNWIYMALFIVSLLLGIVLKVASAVRDGKVTKDEAEEIKKAVDEAKDEIKKEAEKNAKE